MRIRKNIDTAAGKLCEVLLPIKGNFFLGNGKDLAICTLSSIDLLKQIAESKLINRAVLVGRLLSENKGIDAIIKFSLENPNLKTIIICGKEVKGHRAGQALLALAKNGIDQYGRIIGATGPYPILESSQQDVQIFRTQVKLVDKIGILDPEQLVT